MCISYSQEPPLTHDWITSMADGAVSSWSSLEPRINPGLFSVNKDQISYSSNRTYTNMLNWKIQRNLRSHFMQITEAMKGSCIHFVSDMFRSSIRGSSILKSLNLLYARCPWATRIFRIVLIILLITLMCNNITYERLVYILGRKNESQVTLCSGIY